MYFIIEHDLLLAFPDKTSSILKAEAELSIHPIEILSLAGVWPQEASNSNHPQFQTRGYV